MYVRILQGQGSYALGTLIVWRAQSISSDCARRACKIILLKSALLETLGAQSAQGAHQAPFFCFLIYETKLSSDSFLGFISLLRLF
jgi:hypothetical protein